MILNLRDLLKEGFSMFQFNWRKNECQDNCCWIISVLSSWRVPAPGAAPAGKAGAGTMTSRGEAEAGMGGFIILNQKHEIIVYSATSVVISRSF